MLKICVIVITLFCIRIISFMQLNIDGLFYPYQFLNKHMQSAFLSITGSPELTNSILGKFYTIVVIYTILRILIHLGLPLIINKISMLFSLFGFSRFESMLIPLKIIFSPVETIVLIGNNLKTLSQRNLYSVFVSGFSSSSLASMALFYLIIPEYILLVLLSHISGILISILICNIIFSDHKHKNDFHLTDPYKDSNVLDAMINGIETGSKITIHIVSLIVGLSVMMSIFSNMFSFITLPNVISQYLVSTCMGEFVMINNFEINRQMVCLLLSFSNVGVIGIQSIAVYSVAPDFNVKQKIIKAFFISLICNFIRMLILY